MQTLGLGVLAFAILATGLPGQAAPSGTAPDSELLNAFRRSESVEIYVVRRDLETAAGIHADGLRRLGCRYTLHRTMPAWAELELAVRTASVRIEQTSVYGELRVGMVFGDRTGTLFEIYADDSPLPEGGVAGFVQRRQVTISASFAEALHRFAEAHPNMAHVERERPELCGRPQPPAGIPLAPPPFHFSDPVVDREYYQAYGEVLAKSELSRRSVETARTALAAARGTSPGSPVWLRARDAIEQAILDRRPHRAALSAYLRFLHGARRRVQPAEVEIVDEFERQAQEEVTASSDALLDLLAVLAGIRIGQWPP